MTLSFQSVCNVYRECWLSGSLVQQFRSQHASFLILELRVKVSSGWRGVFVAIAVIGLPAARNLAREFLWASLQKRRNDGGRKERGSAKQNS